MIFMVRFRMTLRVKLRTVIKDWCECMKVTLNLHVHICELAGKIISVLRISCDIVMEESQ